MISLRPVVFVAFAAAAVVAAGCNKEKSPAAGGGTAQASGELSPDTVVATYADKKVTVRQLDEHIASNAQMNDELQKLDKQRYELRRQALDNMILQDLVKTEAGKQGKGEEEFLRSEIEKDQPQPSEEEIKKFYEQVKGNLPEGATYEQVKPQIVNYLTGQQRQEKARAYFDDLKKKNNVAITLPAPQVPRKQAEAIGPSKGPEGAPVTIVEFSDFQCPFCGRAAETVDKVMANYAGKVRLHFRHFPLDFHKEAPKAGEASMCAEEQGKFWEYHDALYRNQGSINGGTFSDEKLIELAGETGLDTESFESGLTSGRFESIVERDLREAQDAGIQGTPSFIVNGQRLVGPQPLEAFEQVIEEELQKAGGGAEGA